MDGWIWFECSILYIIMYVLEFVLLAVLKMEVRNCKLSLCVFFKLDPIFLLLMEQTLFFSFLSVLSLMVENC